ncbi:diguanylate cyclase/phosphodiesterase [Jatrophihabitans sp. GAS493]|uniref:putative bifunctional diguanylate cyclase/phosphodiesterase n=1 Tax=Jatrophihabitans sp. GAS493 TaxID=1907575 RepID=UPI000BB70DF6|nr:bifunctional diguanylate cyclase/phosphodiesterase [Jatrophihabitans sp. GAS493]SOD71239.1 diguanylate cyclase/phosphodiesterase [Jatrophihabitans sp. GAS493]
MEPNTATERVRALPRAEHETRRSLGDLARRLQTSASLRPAVATRQIFARTTGLLYAAGGGLALAMILLSRPMPRNVWSMVAIAGLCVLAGIFMMLRGERLEAWTHHFFIALGTVLIAVGVYLAGGGARSVGLASLFMFVSLGCFFCFAWSVALVHLAFIEICSMFAFTVAGVTESDVIVQQGCMIAVGIVVGYMTRATAAAERDLLTGLLNRRGFDRRLREAIVDAQHTGDSLSVLLLDLDDFKSINERSGHPEGDRCLREVANIWKRLVTDGMLLARPGDDEFAIMLPGYTANRAAAFADQLRAAVADESLCSAGVAELQADDSRSMLVGRAEVALYEAKRNGGGHSIQFGVVDVAAADDIHAGLQLGQFEVYYQPIIDLNLREVIGDEALIRWNHPTKGLVAPDDFIPAAEKSGAIHALGQWILNEACAGTAAYIKTSGLPRRVSVNASGHELKSTDYAANVAAVLASTGLPPSALVIEVTESTFDADHPHVISVLHDLRQLGVGIAIDDFGTGYSSLNRLDHLPANVLKIDRSFVAAIPVTGAEVPILKAIVALADALGLRIIAEGVETLHQAEVLAGLGCSHAQGYYFGRPHPDQQATRVPESLILLEGVSTAA